MGDNEQRGQNKGTKGSGNANATL